jgi:hypothetical protein
MWKAAAASEVLSQHFLEGTEENNEKSQSGCFSGGNMKNKTVLFAQPRTATLSDIFLYHRYYAQHKLWRSCINNLAAWQNTALTFLCSAARASHIEATILDTSPKLAFGFWPLMAAWVSRKKRAYADTGLENTKKHALHVPLLLISIIQSYGINIIDIHMYMYDVRKFLL